MSEPHDIPLFTKEHWAPHLEKLRAQPGGMLVITVEIFPGLPDCPAVGFAIFNAEERAALKRSIDAVREQR